MEHRDEIAEAFEGSAALLLKHLADRRDLSLTAAAVPATLRSDGPVRLTALACAIGLVDLRQARRSRLAGLLTSLSAEDEATLADAVHVALPILERLIENVRVSQEVQR